MSDIFLSVVGNRDPLNDDNEVGPIASFLRDWLSDQTVELNSLELVYIDTDVRGRREANEPRLQAYLTAMLEELGRSNVQINFHEITANPAEYDRTAEPLRTLAAKLSEDNRDSTFHVFITSGTPATAIVLTDCVSSGLLKRSHLHQRIHGNAPRNAQLDVGNMSALAAINSVARLIEIGAFQGAAESANDLPHSSSIRQAVSRTCSALGALFEGDISRARVWLDRPFECRPVTELRGNLASIADVRAQGAAASNAVDALLLFATLDMRLFAGQNANVLTRTRSAIERSLRSICHRFGLQVQDDDGLGKLRAQVLDAALPQDTEPTWSVFGLGAAHPRIETIRDTLRNLDHDLIHSLNSAFELHGGAGNEVSPKQAADESRGIVGLVVGLPDPELMPLSRQHVKAIADAVRQELLQLYA